MYRQTTSPNKSAEAFRFPLEETLTSNNRWVVLSGLVPWDEFEAEYAQQFSAEQGAPAKPFRMALGALLIKERLGLSDEETVEQIRENPYLQYFLGLEEYSQQAPFSASMLVHFRKRLPLEFVNRINERIVIKALSQGEGDILQESDPSSKRAVERSSPPEESKAQADETADAQGSLPTHQGDLILDASCAPADITYPTDLRLLNEAREHSESIIDQLYAQIRENLDKKPRTYRQLARQEFLMIAKKRKPTAKQRRKALRKQLNYLNRNLGHIEALLEAGASLEHLSVRDYQLLLVISEVYRQQLEMYEQRTQRVDNRIVSLAQPHVRPIVRGKAGKPVEFGAKFSASSTAGFFCLDHLSWDNFNEAGDLIPQIEAYQTRFGYYPQTVYVDAIYRTRANRKWCQERGIRLMGPPLGRPAQAQKKILAQQLREDERTRTQIEGKFGQGKRRFSLSRVMAKLACTAETTIAITFLVINLERLLRQVCSLFLPVFSSLVLRFRALADLKNCFGLLSLHTSLISI